MSIRPTYLITLLLCLLSFKLYAQQGITVSDAWIPQAPPVAKVMAGYMEIENKTQKDITILSVSSPQFGAIEMHETVTEAGVAKMLRRQRLKVPAGKELRFQRGGLHLMMFRPKQPLKLNEEVTIQLETSAGMVDFKARVKEAELEDHSHHHH